MEQDKFKRQLGIFNPEDFKDKKVTVIGTGSVGSFVVLTLSKMGIKNIEVWDDDIIEEHNLSNQFYPNASVGMLKVEALKDMIREMTGEILTVNKDRFEWGRILGYPDIVISAVDSIVARREIWKSILNNLNVKLYIDARMGGELMRIFTVRGQEDYSFYENSLKEEGIQLPCTERTIIYNVTIISGLVALIIKKFLKGEELYKEVMFDLRNMLLTVTRDN